MSYSGLKSLLLALIYQLLIADAVRNHIYDYAAQHRLKNANTGALQQHHLHKMAGSGIFAGGGMLQPYAMPSQRFGPNAQGLLQHNNLMSSTGHHFVPLHRIPLQPYKGYRKKRKVLYRFVPHYNGLIINFKSPPYLPEQQTNRFKLNMLNAPFIYSPPTYASPAQQQQQQQQQWLSHQFPSFKEQASMLGKTTTKATQSTSFYRDMQEQQQLMMIAPTTTTQNPHQLTQLEYGGLDQWIPIAQDKRQAFKAFAAPNRETAISPLNSHEPITSYKPLPFPTAAGTAATASLTATTTTSTTPALRPAKLIRSTMVSSTPAPSFYTTTVVGSSKKSEAVYEFHPITAYDGALSFGSLLDSSFYTTQNRLPPISEVTAVALSSTMPAPTTTTNRSISPKMTASFLDFWLDSWRSTSTPAITTPVPPTRPKPTGFTSDHALTASLSSTQLAQAATTTHRSPSQPTAVATSPAGATYAKPETKKRKYFYAKKFPTSPSFSRNASTTTTTVIPAAKSYKSAMLLKKPRPNGGLRLPRLRLKPVMRELNVTTSTPTLVANTNAVLLSASTQASSSSNISTTTPSAVRMAPPRRRPTSTKQTNATKATEVKKRNVAQRRRVARPQHSRTAAASVSSRRKITAPMKSTAIATTIRPPPTTTQLRPIQVSAATSPTPPTTTKITLARGRNNRTPESAIMKINKMTPSAATKRGRQATAANANAIPQLPIEVYFKQQLGDDLQ